MSREFKPPHSVRNVEVALRYAEKHGFPIQVMSLFSLNWQPTAAMSLDQLEKIAQRGIELSPIGIIELTLVSLSNRQKGQFFH